MASEPGKRDDQPGETAPDSTVPVQGDSAARTRPDLRQTVPDAAQDATPQACLLRTISDSAQGEAAAPGGATGGPAEEPWQVPSVPQADPAAQAGRFAVVGEVGSGGTSRVFAVLDHSLGRTIALKVLQERAEGKRSGHERFMREARVTARLEHPNILPVHDIGVTSRGDLFFSMTRAAGRTLGDAIRAAKAGQTVPGEFATVDGRVRICLKVCDALAFAHSKAFIHQDVKPDNVMLGEYGEVLLLDWGSAIAREDTAGAAGKGLYGTPAYMSPEQARREGVDERSDVYCLGATLFHALLPDRTPLCARAAAVDRPARSAGRPGETLREYRGACR
jgi:hypothetical protein